MQLHSVVKYFCSQLINIFRMLPVRCTPRRCWVAWCRCVSCCGTPGAPAAGRRRWGGSRIWGPPGGHSVPPDRLHFWWPPTTLNTIHCSRILSKISRLIYKKYTLDTCWWLDLEFLLILRTWWSAEYCWPSLTRRSKQGRPRGTESRLTCCDLWLAGGGGGSPLIYWTKVSADSLNYCVLFSSCLLPLRDTVKWPLKNYNWTYRKYFWHCVKMSLKLTIL